MTEEHKYFALIATGDDDMAGEIAGALQDHTHFIINTASRGDQALRLLHDYQYDLLISDVDLVEYSGIQLSRWVMENSKETKVILLAEYPGDTVDAEIDGVEKVFKKPINMEGFAEEVFSCMG